MIDTSNLDILKTYVVNEIGDSEEAKIIQELQHQVYKNIPVNDIATHTWALRFKNGQWLAYENHLKHGGIAEFPVSQYSSDAKRFLINPYPLNNDSLDYHLKFNPGYSLLNLAEIVEKRLIGLPLPNTKGWVCSQSIAAGNYKICLDLNLKFEVLCPIDFQYYFTK